MNALRITEAEDAPSPDSLRQQREFLGSIEDFCECCAYQRYFLDLGIIELAVAVDNLQWPAERWHLVEAIGQNEVQRIMETAFAEGPPEPILPGDLVRDCELADPRDRWRHTGETPPYSEKQANRSQPYVTCQSTVDAFFHVVRSESTDRILEWLARHPQDAQHLHKLWKQKCSTPAR
jgi:hypothetical protein